MTLMRQLNQFCPVSKTARLPGDVSVRPEPRSDCRNVSIIHLKFSEKERMGVGSE